MRRPAMLLDRAMLALVGVASAYLAFATPVPGLLDFLAPGSRAALVVAALALALGLAFMLGTHAAGRAPRWAARAGLLCVTALVTVMALDRLVIRLRDAQETDHWPPRPETVLHTTIDSLTPAERARWAVRIAAHRITSTPSSTDTVEIPSDWPFPTDVSIGRRRMADGRLEVWARTRNGTSACLSVGVGDGTKASAEAAATCERMRVAPSRLAFIQPRRALRSTGHIPLSAGPLVGAPWPQYRHDGAHTGATQVAPVATTGWRTRIDGPIRSTAAVVGDVVLAGTHGTGTLAALDLATGAIRWSVRVPNWIHQDAVSDGRVVVVGFGDNARSFSNRAPSGVAAYEVATGRHLWTSFDEGSVMTSPVIQDSVIVYGTGSGSLRKRALATGMLLGERQLPGGVTMAPPASLGDTIIFALDHDAVCSIRISTLETQWCRRFPELRMLGHAAPTIDRDRVMVTGAATLLTPSIRELLALPREQFVRLVSGTIFPSRYETHAGQVFLSLDLEDGHTEWQSPLFANPRIAGGHLAGTAVFGGELGAIILPMSDTLVAFDRATGAVRWTATGMQARGPALVVNDRVIRTGRDGWIRARALDDGRILCEEHRPRGYDRAGPTLADGLLIFGTLDGYVEALPAAPFLTCRGEAPESVRATRSAPPQS